MTYRVDGVLINFANSTGSQEEAAAYLSHALERHPGWSSRLSCLTVQMDGEDALLDYTLSGPRFERIRRITGYLVGTTDRWNNAKSHELEDRVTHDTERATTANLNLEPTD